MMEWSKPLENKGPRYFEIIFDTLGERWVRGKDTDYQRERGCSE